MAKNKGYMPMATDAQIEELLSSCKSLPTLKECRAMNPLHPEKAPVDASKFPLATTPRMIFCAHTDYAIRTFVLQQARETGCEATLLLIGDKNLFTGTVTFRDFHAERGKRYSAVFSKEAMNKAISAWKAPSKEVVFAHSHVSGTSCYNMFSLEDLKLLMRMALTAMRDTYGMLVTEDTMLLVKYELATNRFYRVNFEFRATN